MAIQLKEIIISFKIDHFMITFHYRLKQVDYDGTSEYSNIVEVNLFTVKEFELSQNYPNPFNPWTTISFQLPEASFISLKVFDALGTEVASVAEGKYPVGVREVVFDADKLSSGLYLYRIISGSTELTRNNQNSSICITASNNTLRMGMFIAVHLDKNKKS